MDNPNPATPSPTDEDLTSQIAMDELSPNVFISRSYPQQVGNALPIGYGGCTLAVIVQAACRTVPGPQYQLFSCLGSFLGPSSIEHKVRCRVVRIRDTRSFATRSVTAFQVLGDGIERVCATAMVDFHVEEVAMFTYGVRPSDAILSAGPEDERYACTPQHLLSRAVEDGRIDQAVATQYDAQFGLLDRFFDSRYSTTSVSAQNLFGLAPHVPTSHDAIPITQRPQFEWIKLHRPLSTQADNWAALAFYMDGGLAFLPLHLDHKSLRDAGACSTLEFALRIVRPEAGLGEWCLRERKTLAATSGKTLSEGWLWDRDGRVVATVSQTSIMRAKRGGVAGQKL